MMINYQETKQGRDSIRLRYPLEDWIEQLLEKYPEELEAIKPEIATRRSKRLYQMQRSLKDQVTMRCF